MPVKDNILITSNFSSDTGCAWKFFFRLFNFIAENLHERGIGITLSFARVVEPVTILDPKIPFQVFTFDPLNLSFSGVLNLLQNVRKHNIKYCYLTDFASWHWLYALLRLWGVRKIIVHSHVSVAAPYAPLPEIGIKRTIKKLLNNFSLFAADSLYACSEFVKDRLVRKACYPASKIKVITHGIDIDRFLCQVERKPAGEKIVIFTVARATRHKGIQVLIEAARILRDEYQRFDFVVEYGGDGPDFDDFRQLVAEYKLEEQFIFLRALNDTREKTCNADIVVVPSCWGDAYPLSVIEAMSAGKPVVATDVGGIPEEIGTEECGILCKPGDSRALADQLELLIKEPSMRTRIGANARERAEKLFTEKRFYREVIFSLVADMGIEQVDTPMLVPQE